MKIIFLDIDGVLNHKSSPFEYPIDSFCVGLVNSLIADTGAKIVMSTSWRDMDGKEYNPTFGHFEVEQPFSLRNFLVSQGLKNNFQSDWATPILNKRPRGFEIQVWLNKHPDVKEYVILDDVDEFTKDQHAHYIKTSMLTGFTVKDYEEAEKILKVTK